MSANARNIRSDLARIDAHVIQPEEYEEAPELTDEQLANAEVRIGGKIVRRGRPPLDSPKQLVSLRLSREVLAHFRSGGDGWQTRINDTLVRAVRRQARTKRSG